jgi:retron-type reverse transcriptase
MTTRRAGQRARAIRLAWSEAWKRVLNDSQNDILPDPLEYADYRHDARPHVERARRLMKQGYQPRDVLRIDVPKQGFTLRPGTTLLIEDRLVYQALIDTFAARLDRKLEPDTVVCGYRVLQSSRGRMFRRWRPVWLRFQDMIRDGYEVGGYGWLLNTDVVAYFDHINHGTLRQQLRDHDVPEPVLDVLFRLLRHWSEPSGIGIPQGHDPSSFLGNVYLDPVDKAMVRAGYRYFRYSDDTYVFGRSKAELKRALALLIAELRKVGLHIQEAKTHFYEGPKILEMVDERRDELAAVDYAMAAGQTTLALADVRAILRDLSRSPSSFNERHFRKCLNTLGKVGSDMAVGRTLRRLDLLAHAADHVARYLAIFVNRPRVQRALMDFLQDDERNLYSWQELWFLWALRSARSLPREFLNLCRERMRSSAVHWACRSGYALLLGKLGDPADLSLIAGHISDRSNLVERRAFVAAIQGMERSRRNGVLARLAGAHPELADVVAYVRSR